MANLAAEKTQSNKLHPSLCHCYIGETESLGNPVIRFCSLHESAREMLDALEEIHAQLNGMQGLTTVATKQVHTGTTVDELQAMVDLRMGIYAEPEPDAEQLEPMPEALALLNAAIKDGRQ